MINVLFVCLGNICRSPMAEAVFYHQVEERGLSDKVSVDSAGTSNWHVGKRPHEGTLNKLAEHQINTNGMYARQLIKEDGALYDYIVTMDESNLQNSIAIVGKTKAEVFNLLDLVDDMCKDVPDPYYTGDFTETYELVTRASKKLLQKIVKEHKL